MNGRSRHPAAAELAEFRAGVTEGVRGDQVAAHLAVCLECASVSGRLVQIPALLASIPQPAMPDDIEARITAAIGAEAARRASAFSDSAAGLSAPPAVVPLSPAPRVLSTVPHTVSAPPRTFPGARRRPLRPLGVVVAAAACLVFALVGYQLSSMGQSGSPTASPPSTATGGPSPRAGGGLQAGGKQPAMGPAPPGAFVVLISTVNFRQATLQQQVRQQLTSVHDTGPMGPGGRQEIPSTALIGCVTHLTGHAMPTLVELAAYQSRPVYMIALTNHAWVVEHGCTAGNPEIIASVSLSPVP